MTKTIDEFDAYREEMNEKILGSDHLGIKRFFALDHQAYESGALDGNTAAIRGRPKSNAGRSGQDCASSGWTWRSWCG